MIAIETVATITAEGTMTAKVPGYLAQGEHRVVIVIDESPFQQPSASRFPDMAGFRERLGAKEHRGNTILEMREE